MKVKKISRKVWKFKINSLPLQTLNESKGV